MWDVVGTLTGRERKMVGGISLAEGLKNWFEDSDVTDHKYLSTVSSWAL